MAAEFKATGSSVVHKLPFVPKIPARPLLQVQNFVQHAGPNEGTRKGHKKSQKHRRMPFKPV